MQQVILRAMAKEQKDMTKFVSSFKNTLLEHLMKVIINGEDDIALHHHLAEILAYCKKIISVRDKLWYYTKSRKFFEMNLLDSAELINELSNFSLRTKKKVYDTFEFHNLIMPILYNIYDKYLYKKKIPTEDWLKNQFKLVWKYIKNYYK